MSTEDIDPDILEVLIQERSRGRQRSPEEAARNRRRQKLLAALDKAMRRADQRRFSDALRSAGINEGSPVWKNAWAAYHAYQKRR